MPKDLEREKRNSDIFRDEKESSDDCHAIEKAKSKRAEEMEHARFI